MIITVTLNPAVDQTLVLERFLAGDTNRVRESRIDPGGKGINVSRVLRELGRESMAAGLAPGSLGRFVEHSLLELGILCDFVHTRGQTRTNLTVVDDEKHETTLLSYRGPEIDPRHMQTLETRLRRYVKPRDWLVIAGSIPPPIGSEAYPRLIELARQARAYSVLDADAEALELGLAAGPDMVKSNHHEAERLLGREIETDADLLRAADEMHVRGATTAIVTASSRGAIAVTDTGAWRCKPLEMTVVSSTGAGDAFLAGVLSKLDDGSDLEEALRWGTAAGAASCLTSGTQPCHRRDVDKLVTQVQIEQIRHAEPVRS
jgi:1-phosphofructokinase